MTGLSGSGKSTIATLLEEQLTLQHGKAVYRLDGDNVRTGLNRDLGFSAGDRAESVRRVGELACLFADGGTITIVSLISPYKADRDAVRQRHEDMGLKFIEVFMDVPLKEVQDRDPKGLYAKVASGELKHFTGVDDPYEAPENAELVIKNHELTIQQSVDVIMRKLREEGCLVGGPSLPHGLPYPDGDELIDLHVSDADRPKKTAEAETLPKVLLTDIDVNWLQTIGEGWAAPLKGFMREGELLQTIHFNSLLVDPYNLQVPRICIKQLQTLSILPRSLQSVCPCRYPLCYQPQGIPKMPSRNLERKQLLWLTSKAKPWVFYGTQRFMPIVRKRLLREFLV